MKIALVGYGKMGRIIEQIALERGHVIVSKIDIHNPDEFDSEAFRSAEVAIEFTTPATAFDNYRKCFAVGIPVVSGTTGWTHRIDEIKRQCEEEGQTFFYASNFSIGVNLFFALNRRLAKLMNAFPAYDVSLTEIHHIHKLDAPSGTGLTLAEGILEEISRKKRWRLTECCPAAHPADAATTEAMATAEGTTAGATATAGKTTTGAMTTAETMATAEGTTTGGTTAGAAIAEATVTGVATEATTKATATGTEATGDPGDLLIRAIRKGEVPGIHEICYESEADRITIRHEAKSRAGFALGAVLAAEFTAGRKGFLGMKEMLQSDDD
jgi:dihydrodipicolinate reductase